MTTKSPNITLIMADQLAPRYLPSYGHPIVPAPTLHRLSEEGVTFDAASTNSPLCAPSRFVMMIGRLPSNISTWKTPSSFQQKYPLSIPYQACARKPTSTIFFEKRNATAKSILGLSSHLKC
ncbi:sulfatase-like hydrolase/transferase [Arenicellales bacterium nBUS_48]